MQATAANRSAGIRLQARLPGREPAARLDLKPVFAQTGIARTVEARSELRDGARNTPCAYGQQLVPSKTDHILVKPAPPPPRISWDFESWMDSQQLANS
jgi:hypothetical protein